MTYDVNELKNLEKNQGFFVLLTGEVVQSFSKPGKHLPCRANVVILMVRCC